MRKPIYSGIVMLGSALLATTLSPAVADEFYEGETIRVVAKADKDGQAVYGAWGGQYEFQRLFVTPPGVPKDRLEILRKGYAANFKDPEFFGEAEKSKLYLDYVSAEEINGHVKEILDITPKAKADLQFLVRKRKTN
jgi:hypothetical protein